MPFVAIQHGYEKPGIHKEEAYTDADPHTG